MRPLWPALAMMAVAGCGASVATEPYQLPQGANDLDRTPYIFHVYAGNGVQGSRITQVQVVGADMTDVLGTLPEGDFPVTKTRTFPVTGSAVAQGNLTSTAPTFELTLFGPPAGHLFVKLTGVAGSSRSAACVAPARDAPRTYGPADITVVLSPAPGPACDIP